MHIVAALLGVACFALLALGGRYASAIVPEFVGQLAWRVFTCAAAAFCGHLKPARAWRWGAIIVGIQPVCLLLLLGVMGELTNPTRSTGGMVARRCPRARWRCGRMRGPAVSF
jgi:hypothetical protein